MADMDQARAAKLKARAELLARSGVHAVGIGHKTVGGQLTDELAIVVLVVKKKPPSELDPDEMIPAEIDGVKTDVLERSMPTPCVADEAKDRPLEGGLQIQPQDRSSGTLGCFTTIPDQPNKVYALTNFHVVATGDGQATNLRLSTGTPPARTITVSTLPAAATIKPEHSLAAVTLRSTATGAVSVFYVQTAAVDTPTSVATKIAAEINAGGFSATASAAVVTITSGVSIKAEPYGRTLASPEPSLQAIVSTPSITLRGKVAGDHYGIFTAVSLSGLEQPTRGTFIAVPKGQPLANIAAALAASLSQPGIGLTATSSGPTVTVVGADFIECNVVDEIRMGQSDAQFASECCDWCPDTIGRTVAARYDFDSAVIELEPGLEYQADIKDLGHVTGSRPLTPADMAAHIHLKKRGRTTQVTEAQLMMLHVDGFSAGFVDEDHKDLGRFGPRRYNDCFLVEALTTAATDSVAAGGDSGSMFLDGRTVVGQLFAAGGPVPADGTTPAQPAVGIGTHIEPLLAAFGAGPGRPMQIVTATKDDETKQVLAPNGARSVLGIGRNQRPSFGVVRERIREVEAAIASTSGGRLQVEMVRRRTKEAVFLVNQNRRVGVAWQRNGGPVLLRALLRAVEQPESIFPVEIMGKPIDQCLEAIARALRAHASPGFVRDLDQFAPTVTGLGGKNYREMIAQIRDARRRDEPAAHPPPAE